MNPKAPVWVAISTRLPIEVLERGRTVGTSWGGGLRLVPGAHELHIINRATNAETHQTVNVVAGTPMSLVVDLVDGRLRVEAKSSEQ